MVNGGIPAVDTVEAHSQPARSVDSSSITTHLRHYSNSKIHPRLVVRCSKITILSVDCIWIEMQLLFITSWILQLVLVDCFNSSFRKVRLGSFSLLRVHSDQNDLRQGDSTNDAGSHEGIKPVEQRRRRKRYSGSYPKFFSEKYKEHRGDIEILEKVRSKGMTPAGTHIPIMYQECLQHMGFHGEHLGDGDILVIDCTLGYGGHSSQILSYLSDKGVYSELVAFDQDSVEIQKTEERLRQHLLNKQKCLDRPVTFEVVNDNFSNLGHYLKSKRKLGCVNSLLADLGLSSMQIDDDLRGFTYKRDGPLDMRMNPLHNETAYELLSRLTPKQFKRLLEENSDEKYSREIAYGIYKQHPGSQYPEDVLPSTTLELADRVRNITKPLIMTREKLNNNDQIQIGKKKEAEIKKELDSTVARTMQALRIELNGEFRALETLLLDLPSILAPGGKAVFLTFHSGEDRRVKKAFKEGAKNGIYSSWSRDVVRPSKKEMWDNPRSTCCKLRWGIRSELPIVNHRSIS